MLGGGLEISGASGRRNCCVKCADKACKPAPVRLKPVAMCRLGYCEDAGARLRLAECAFRLDLSTAPPNCEGAQALAHLPGTETCQHAIACRDYVVIARPDALLVGSVGEGNGKVPYLKVSAHANTVGGAFGPEEPCAVSQAGLAWYDSCKAHPRCRATAWHALENDSGRPCSGDNVGNLLALSSWLRPSV